MLPAHSHLLPDGRATFPAGLGNCLTFGILPQHTAGDGVGSHLLLQRAKAKSSNTARRLSNPRGVVPAPNLTEFQRSGQCSWARLTLGVSHAGLGAGHDPGGSHPTQDIL